MAKRQTGKGGGRRRPPPASEQGPGELDLLQTIQAGLRSDEPLDLLATVSGLVEVTDPRRDDPFRPDERPNLQELVDSFIGTPHPETTAVLAVIRVLVPDELMRVRIGRALAQRNDPLPEWLTGLDHARIESEVWFLTDTLGDGDDYFFGVTLPTGHQLSALVYVDHNLGGVVKDAFVVPEALTVLAEQVVGRVIDADQTLSKVDPADARAVVEAAIEESSRLYPPVESDSWPMCRPVIEWMLRMLPAGGTVPERPEWTEEQLDQLADDFFRSPLGAALDDHDGRGLLQSVLWFATGYGPGDPLRWSPVAVEMLLLDFVPRKVMAEPSYLARVPEVLRAYVRYAHGRQGIPAALTKETVQVIDAIEPEFLQRIRTTTPQGPAAMIAQLIEANGGELTPELLRSMQGMSLDDLMLGGGRTGRDDLISDEDLAQTMLDDLGVLVGGPARLAGLTAKPLPDEEFVWEGIADDIRPVVREVLTACDGCADSLLDVEHRTAMRRFLARAAVGDPSVFRRKASPVRGAAAVAWAVCRANGTVGGSGSPLSVQELLDWFEVKGAVSQRAEPLLRAIGADPRSRYGEIALGTPDLLVSGCRADIIEQRERWLEE